MLARLLARVAPALRRGGLFAFDVMVRRRAGEPLTRYQTARSGHDWAVLTDVAEAEDGATIGRVIVTFRRTPDADRYRRSEEHHDRARTARG